MNSKTNHFLNLFLIFGVCVVFSILISNEVYAACLSVPVGGTYTINNTATGGTGGCAFAGTVDGVDNGGIIIDADQTLTINAGQTIVWSPGSSITVNGSIAINKSGGAQLRKTYLWMTDADSDGYPASSTQVAQDTTPTGGRRRSALTNFTYTSGCTYDYNDSSASVYPGTTCNGVCSVNNTDGTCGAAAAGENGLAACTRCNGSSLSAVNVTNNTQDAEGSNVCNATCKNCNGSGSCVNQGSSEDLFSQCSSGYNACSGDNRIGPDGYCDGSGACDTNDLSDACATAGTCQTGGGCSDGSCVTVSTIPSTYPYNGLCWRVGTRGVAQASVCDAFGGPYGGNYSWDSGGDNCAVICHFYPTCACQTGNNNCYHSNSDNGTSMCQGGGPGGADSRLSYGCVCADDM